MSRRRQPRKRPDAPATVLHDYRAVRFVCPSGHTLAPTALLDDDGAHIYGMDPEAAQWLDTPAGGKLAMRCSSCESAGRRLDLQASWPKVLALLDDERGMSTYVLGGA